VAVPVVNSIFDSPCPTLLKVSLSLPLLSSFDTENILAIPISSFRASKSRAVFISDSKLTIFPVMLTPASISNEYVFKEVPNIFIFPGDEMPETETDRCVGPNLVTGLDQRI
jgi:hypothetical protein